MRMSVAAQEGAIMPTSVVNVGWCLRSLMLSAVVLCATPGPCGYQARLWFENLTTGASNVGVVLAEPGDTVAIRYEFLADTPGLEKWGVLQVTLILDGLTLISEEDTNEWCPQVYRICGDGQPDLLICWHPNDGAIYDNAVGPGDDEWPLVTTRACYGIAGGAELGLRPSRHTYGLVHTDH